MLIQNDMDEPFERQTPAAVRRHRLPRSTATTTTATTATTAITIITTTATFFHSINIGTQSRKHSVTEASSQSHVQALGQAVKHHTRSQSHKQSGTHTCSQAVTDRIVAFQDKK